MNEFLLSEICPKQTEQEILAQLISLLADSMCFSASTSFKALDVGSLEMGMQFILFFYFFD